jgi:methylmalonyl-CoA mutase N-terminal domain/subunit
VTENRPQEEPKPHYGVEDAPQREEAPGAYPYTRGIYPTMYRNRLWTMRQYMGFGAAKETNQRLRYLLSQGETGLSIAFDLPTQLGLDSDNPRSFGEIGKVGVAVSILEDMREVFKGISLKQVSTSMTINATAPVLFSMYAAIAEEQGAKPEEVRGTVQNDILKEYLARNTFIFPPAQSMRLAIDLVEYSVEKYPKWHPISISGYHIREAGATAVQELAFTFADAMAYVEEALKRGLALDDFAPHLSFFFACNNDFLEEVAKFRAARRIWARIMKERFGAKNDESMKLRFHTQTAGETLTAQDPENNVVRVAIQALAAAMGGTQSLHTNSRDEALGLPSEDSARLALRTQQIIAHESGITAAPDPLGGSYLLERLTSKLEKLAMDEVQNIEKMGGMLRSIENGYVKREILSSAYRKQLEIEAGQRVIVGVNKYKPKKGYRYKVQTVPAGTQRLRVAQLKRLKRRRDDSKVKSSLEGIRSVAVSSHNLMPAIVQAVGSRCTVGEMSDVLREVFGEYKPGVPL